MQLLLSLLVAHAAVATACSYPLNEPRFANSTLLTEYITIATAEIPDATTARSE
jgi:hypothetical protein